MTKKDKRIEKLEKLYKQAEELNEELQKELNWSRLRMSKVKVTKPPKRIQKDLTGKKFGRLTVIGFNRIQKGSYRWACECECGNVVSVPYSRLMRGETKSCGCILRELKTKHGKSNTRLYTAWENMKTRCYNPNDDFYADYGGRGIKVCDEWLDDFTSFYI